MYKGEERVWRCVYLVCKEDLTPRYVACGVYEPHPPHIHEVVHRELQGEPVERILCSGAEASWLRIYQRVGAPPAEYIIVLTTDENYERIPTMYDRTKWDVMTQRTIVCDVVRAEGSREHCGKREPHEPHVTDVYDTVRWGTLTIYCPGWSGDGLQVYESVWRGDAQQPDRSCILVFGG